jgi:hypothetical protein
MFQRIVVFLDGYRRAESALPIAARLAFSNDVLKQKRMEANDKTYNFTN